MAVESMPEHVGTHVMCPVCISLTRPGEQAVRLRCNHAFHLDCFHRYMDNTSGADIGCPRCRRRATLLWYAVGPGTSQAREASRPTIEQSTWVLEGWAQREEAHRAAATSSAGRSETKVDARAIASNEGTGHWSADPAAWQRFLAEAAASDSDSQEEPEPPPEATEEQPDAPGLTTEDQGGQSPWEQYFSLVLASRESRTPGQPEGRRGPTPWEVYSGRAQTAAGTRPQSPAISSSSASLNTDAGSTTPADSGGGGSL